MKKNTLYTVNPWNLPLFQHHFDEGGPTKSDLIWDQTASKASVYDQINPMTLDEYKNSTNFLGIAKVDNPFSKGNLNNLKSSLAGGITNAVAAPIGSAINKGISGGLSSGAGQAISSIGTTIGGAVGAVNPLAGAAVTLASNVIGGLTNRTFGMGVNQEALREAKEGTERLNNFTSTASSYDGIQVPQTEAAIGKVYKGGWAVSGKAAKKNQQLQDERNIALSWANRSVNNNIQNIGNTTMNNYLANYAAYGGPLDMVNPDGAIDYGFMQDYLTMKKQQIDNKNTPVSYLGKTGQSTLFAKGGNIHIKKSHEGRFTEQAKKAGMGVQEFAAHVLAHKDQYSAETVKRANFARNAAHWHDDGGLLVTPLTDSTGQVIFALGGDMQANGGDYSTGLSHINAGGIHEENPYEGVPMGIASDGAPNLVEEGETIYDDYVFSNRIKPTKDILKASHLPARYSKSTYAEISKKLEKEAEERPNDPISQASLKSMLGKLAAMQEQQKAEEEAERAKEAFEALSPEEQQQVLAQIVAQQQASQEGQSVEQEQPQILETVNQENETFQEPVEENVQENEPQSLYASQEEMPTGYAKGGKIHHKFEKGGNKNTGNWKDPNENHWNIFTRPGLQRFLENLKADLDAAPNDYQKNVIRQQAINRLNSLQQSYYDNVLKDTPQHGKYAYNEGILNHQRLFDEMGGNTGYYTLDPEGNVVNLIANAIDIPQGASTSDIPEKWVDGYNGPRTSIRNFGSTEYGDDAFYKDLVNGFKDLGIQFAPNKNWTYGDQDYELYGLSMAEPEKKAPERWDGQHGGWVSSDEETTPVVPLRPQEAVVATQSIVETPRVAEETPKATDTKLPYKDSRLRYAGVFGPAIGLGLWSAGVGKPDFSRLNGILDSTGQTALATYQPVSHYLTYHPMDVFSQLNNQTASSRATDRAILNSGLSSASKNAALIANTNAGNNSAGDLYTKALNYNNGLQSSVANFNRQTDTQNANAFNQTSQFNANALNRANQYYSSLAANIANQEMAANAGWYNALYGNIGQIAKGLSDIGKDNESWNQVAGLYNAGALGRYGIEDVYGMTSNKPRSKGGKIRRKKG